MPTNETLRAKASDFMMFGIHADACGFVYAIIKNRPLRERLFELLGDGGDGFWTEDVDSYCLCGIESVGDDSVLVSLESREGEIADAFSFSKDAGQNIAFLTTLILDPEVAGALTGTAGETEAMALTAQSLITDGDVSCFAADYEYERATGTCRLDASDRANDLARAWIGWDDDWEEQLS